MGLAFDLGLADLALRVERIDLHIETGCGTFTRINRAPDDLVRSRDFVQHCILRLAIRNSAG